MLLSIGMIVKNEEKHLERCIKALLPLKNKIEYEVVIVDTGSTDRTKEIALKYTDKVYDFEWINDFAAARNYGLEKCTGKWFMFLDADEEIDDCQPLIDFLLSKESEKFNSATINLRSFEDESLSTYSTASLSRIYKNKNICFEGKIHETISVKEPVFYLNCIVNHYGYINDNGKKFIRNNSIIDELLKNNPNDIRLLSYRADSYIADKEYSKIIQIYELFKDSYLNPDTDISSYIKIVQLAIQAYLQMDKVEEAKNVYKMVKRIFTNYEVIKLDGNYYFLSYWNKLELNDEKLADKDIATYAKEYQKIYKKYHENKYDDSATVVICPRFTSQKHYAICKYTLIKYYYYNHEIKKMYEVMDSLYEKSNPFIPFAFDFERIKEFENYDRIVDIYKNLKQCNKENVFLSNVQENVQDENLYNYLMLSLTKKIDVLHSPLREYVSIYNKMEEGDIQYLENLEDLPVEYSDVLYNLMKNNVNIDDFKWLNNPSKQEQYAKILFGQHCDITKIILEYIRKKAERPNFRILGFYCILLYKILVVDNTLSDEDYLYLLDRFLEWQLEYAKYLYNNKLFEEDKIDFLPEKIQCCIYLNKANVSINNKSYKEAIGYIRLANKKDEKLIRGCNLLLPQIEEKKETEFEAYARKIKDIIINLINSGKKQEAFAVYQQYKKVNPKDTELDKYFIS